MANYITKTVGFFKEVGGKGLCGFLGWVVCLFCAMWCTVKNVEAPMVVDSIIIASTSLLGIDSVTGIWKRGENTHKVSAAKNKVKSEGGGPNPSPVDDMLFDERPRRFGEGETEDGAS